MILLFQLYSIFKLKNILIEWLNSDIGALVETIHSPSGHPTLEQFRCSSCLKVFSDKSNCRRHIKCTHVVSPQVTCNYCGKMFKNKRYARVHYGRCTGTQDIFGQMWNKNSSSCFDQFTCASNHTCPYMSTYVHPTAGQDCVARLGPGQFRCLVCTKEFSRSENCRRHVRELHFGLDHEECMACKKVVSTRYIREHRRRCAALN